MTTSYRTRSKKPNTEHPGEQALLDHLRSGWWAGSRGSTPLLKTAARNARGQMSTGPAHPRRAGGVMAVVHVVDDTNYHDH
ncbi:hypothetical protein FRACA_3590007 [Frankia canadensis]|uniref:Uncharacterized protein n=1 Tax=Frankia canadensis TaxID=1836972 RepID=A0A2I2KVG9_9ACTN|nr:hypothetical protein FRACA_3590007 [Frankia canadensis]SOU56938.1 hypothetical protein FRACA_3590007 [Frankia canadensis]